MNLFRTIYGENQLIETKNIAELLDIAAMKHVPGLPCSTGEIDSREEFQLLTMLHAEASLGKVC